MALSQTDFQKFFNPAQIAIIGVSTGEYKFGGMSFLIKLQEGGFVGEIYPINPKAKQIRNLNAYPDLPSLPEVPDLAIVCVAGRFVPTILEDCARTGLNHIHVLTSGFKETGLADGKLLEDRIGGGGGNSVAYSDAFNQEQFEVPPLSDSSMDFFRRSVPIAGSIAGNPLDMWRTFIDAAYLSEVLELGYQDPAIAIIVVDRLIPRKAYHFPDLADPTPEIITLIKDRQHAKPTVFTIDSDGGDPDLAITGSRLRAQFCKNGIPAYPSTKRAARALFHLCQYHDRH